MPRIDGSSIRIEPVEIGGLLALVAAENAQAFLDALIAGDNELHPDRVVDALASTAAVLRTIKSEALIEYIRERGADLGRESPGWTSGLRRTLWLFTGSDSAPAMPADGTLPDDFPYHAAARAIVGAVALFSQLSPVFACPSRSSSTPISQCRAGSSGCSDSLRLVNSPRRSALALT